MATNANTTNWSGSVELSPVSRESPRDEEKIASTIAEASTRGQSVRALGSRHSSSGIVPCDGVLLDLRHFDGVDLTDPDRRIARIGAGVTLRDAGSRLASVGVCMPNLGDVDAQTVVGATATGTHGSGKRFQNLSAMVVGARVVTATGDILEISEDDAPAAMPAYRLSLGTLGIFTSLSIQTLPQLHLRRQEWCLSTEACLESIDDLVATYRNVDFYWYPRRDEVKVRIAHPVEQEIHLQPGARLVDEQVGALHEVLPKPKHLDLKFEEMEYMVPEASWRECFLEARKRIVEHHRKHVAWRVLVRWIAKDRAFLSPAFDRDVVSLSFHQNATLPYTEYFQDIEPRLLEYGGRPHWAKKNFLPPRKLRELFPEFEKFAAIRARQDPGGIFLNAPLRHLFV